MFREWYNQLDANNRHRVYKKIQLAAQRRFAGGEPLFKNLENGEGMRELRFSAYPGGAIRILFVDLSDGGKAILESPVVLPNWIQEKTQLSAATVNACIRM